MKRALPGALFALLVVVVYADPLLTGRMFSGRDLIAYNHPMEKAVHDAYARGRLPVWMEGVSGGRPLLPNPNAGALYPVRAVLSLLSFPAATRWFPVLHWMAAGLGMLVLLRELAASRSGAWLAAVTYVFSGVGVGLVFFPNLHPGAALLPWVLWAAAKRDISPGRRVLALGFLLALDLLAGDVFTVGMALLAVVLWIFACEPAAGRARGGAELAAGALLAALAALPLILAAALWSAETNRAVVGLKLSQAFFYSIKPLRLAELLVPFPFGRTWALADSQVWGFAVLSGRTLGMMATLYAGAIAPLAVAITWRDRSTPARFGRRALAAALALSVLPSLLPAALAGLASPLPLRNPEKLAVLLTFSLAVLSGLAFDRLRAARTAPRGWLLAGAVFALCAVVAALRPSAAGELATGITGSPAALTARAAAQVPEALTEGALGWIVTLLAAVLAGRASRRAGAAALVVLTAVPIAANRRIAQTFREEQVLPRTGFARRLLRWDPEGRFRTLDESFFSAPSALEAAYAGAGVASLEATQRCWYYQTQTLWDRGSVLNHDFDVGDLSRVESLRRLAGRAAGFHDSGDFFGALSLRWGVRFRDQPALAGFHRIGGDALQDWDENPAALPDIRLAGRWREVRGALEALDALPGLAPGEVVLETGARAEGSGGEGSVRILERSPERLVLATRALSPSWLFVLRGFWGYRSVLLDGRPVEYVPAQLAFSAVAVPAGEHSIEWVEQVPGGRASAAGPALFLLAAALILLREHRRGPS